VRDKRYLYIRNYMPWKPRNQPIRYAEQEQSMQELRRLEAEGKLPDNCRWFNEVPKPAEELYDVEADPWQMKNLALDPEHVRARDRLAKEMTRDLMARGDAQFIPEALLSDYEQKLGSRYAIANDARPVGEDIDENPNSASMLARLASAGGWDGASSDFLYDRFVERLPNTPALRFWSVHGIAFNGGNRAVEPLTRLLTDESPIVRVTAAHWLGIRRQAKLALPVLTAALKDKNEFVVLAALTALDEMGEAARPALGDVKALPKKMSEYPGRMRESILNRFK
jgi:hypothetical protein